MTFYLTGARGRYADPHLDAGTIGFLASPSGQQPVDADWVWAADNGCFNAATYVGDDAWISWLTRHRDKADRCLFAVAPDVVGDHDATFARSLPWLPIIRGLGYRAAFVAQDGATIGTVPWDEFDALFIGGSDTFKLGQTAMDLAMHAKGLGMWVHVGRVNSRKRLRHAHLIGADSADGTYLAFGPETNMPKLLGWVADRHANPPLPVEAM